MQEMGKRMVLATAFVALAACSGGGNSSGSASGNGGGVTAPAVVYTGTTVPAPITVSNAQRIAGGAYGTSFAASSIAVAGAIQSELKGGQVLPAFRYAMWLSEKYRQVWAATSASRGQQPVYGVVQQYTNAGSCSNGGTWLSKSTLDTATNTGTMTVTYSQCNEGWATINGGFSANVAYNASGLHITRATISFRSLTFDYGVTRHTMGGTVQDNMDLVNSVRTQTINLVVQDSATGAQAKLQNYNITTSYFPQYQAVNTTGSVTISGRYYHSLFGYVDITTTTPLVYLNMQIAVYPSSGGPLIAKGANGSQVSLQPVNATSVLLSGVDPYGNAFGPFQIPWANL